MRFALAVLLYIGRQLHLTAVWQKIYTEAVLLFPAGSERHCLHSVYLRRWPMADSGFTVRHARAEELGQIMQIYARARKFMAEHGNPHQWGGSNWPPEELIAADIEKGKSYVAEKDGEIAAVFFMDRGYQVEPGYTDVKGVKWNGPETYGVVHRIASSGRFKGAGEFCLRWAVKECGTLRIDTHPDNYVMRSLLTKLGFKETGTVYVREDPMPRYSFDFVPADN